jgi:hypothetical protein
VGAQIEPLDIEIDIERFLSFIAFENREKCEELNQKNGKLLIFGFFRLHAQFQLHSNLFWW